MLGFGGSPAEGAPIHPMIENYPETAFGGSQQTKAGPVF